MIDNSQIYADWCEFDRGAFGAQLAVLGSLMQAAATNFAE
jgi:hypothetical protein